jgi:hypothetical protein
LKISGDYTMKMFKVTSIPCAALAAIIIASPAFASIVSVGGPLSSVGTAPIKIAAPASVTNAAVTNTGQEGFDELQNVLLAAPLTVDGGVIPAGTRVSSHMIFLNKPTGAPSQISHSNVTWTFDGIVLGTMSDTPGNLEAASTPVLGLAGTTYQAPLTNRGMEGADALSFAGNSLTASSTMVVSQPGDWIRVVTAAVPEPTTFLVWGGLCLCVAVGARRRR